MNKRFIAGVLAAVLWMTGCTGGTAQNDAQSSAQGATQENAQDASQDAAAQGGAESTAQTALQESAQPAVQEGEQESAQPAAQEGEQSAQTSGRVIRGQSASEAEPIESQNGNIVILYTNDVHCAVDTGIGYAGLSAYKKKVEEEGNAVFLIDEGDAIQGGVFGSLTKGEAIINLMNDVGYNLAIPGNHEFDYGVERFRELAQIANFPYISCNFEDLKADDTVFDAYVIREIGGKKIGFIGVTTPETITATTPKSYQDENGDFIYSFLQGDGGTELYERIQAAVDTVNAEGVDYTFLLTHLGITESSGPYTSVNVIRNTTGIDAVIDGHSHSTVPMEMVRNKDGEQVVLTQTGSHFKAIGQMTIGQDGGIDTELITDWNQVDPEIIDAIAEERSVFEDVIADQISYSDFDLAVKEDGVMFARNNECNLGDLVADAYRYATGADIAFVNAGSIRDNIPAGEITYGDILMALPYNNELCVVKVKGEAVAEALEYAVGFAPDYFGGFPQVSGITFDVDLDKDAQVQRDENRLFVGFGSDERRVSNIMVGGEPLDPDKEYTVAGTKFVLKEQGDGFTSFADGEMADMHPADQDMFGYSQGAVIIDVDAIAQYLSTMGEKVSDDYADRYGQERIHFVSE